jgi:hypothetical protein
MIRILVRLLHFLIINLERQSRYRSMVVPTINLEALLCRAFFAT